MHPHPRSFLGNSSPSPVMSDQTKSYPTPNQSPGFPSKPMFKRRSTSPIPCLALAGGVPTDLGSIHGHLEPTQVELLLVVPDVGLPLLCSPTLHEVNFNGRGWLRRVLQSSHTYLCLVTPRKSELELGGPLRVLGAAVLRRSSAQCLLPSTSK